MTFEATAAVLLPVDGTGIVVRCGPQWGEQPPADAASVVWGRPAEPAMSSAPSTGRAALRREVALRRLRARPPGALAVRAVHRLPPPNVGRGRLRERVRTAALGGVMVELAAPGAAERRLDAVLRAASVVPQRPLIVGVAGGVIVGGSMDGRDVVARAAMRGVPADPSPSVDALAELQAAAGPAARSKAPTLVASGETSSVAWTVETALPGVRPPRLTPALARAIARFCVDLPRALKPPSSPADALVVIERSLPGYAAAVRSATREHVRCLEGVPSVMEHGDLWSGNLLSHGDSLTGVVDWDAAHGHGVPGVDLLHAVATELGRSRRAQLGSVFSLRPWTTSAFEDAAAEYWRAIELAPDEATLEAIGTAWWLRQVAVNLTRLPELAADRAWVRANVESVLDGSAAR